MSGSVKRTFHFNLMSALGVVIATTTLTSCLLARAESLTMKTVDHVDLQRYSGKWYELARTANRFQKKCVRDVTAEYTLSGDAVGVQNSCVKEDGTTTVIRGKAKVADKTTNARLKVTFFWPFSGDYWILGLGPEYRWAVVGSPGRKYLWILSRTRSLSSSEMEEAVHIAERNGYSRANIVKTMQTGQ